MGLEKHFSPEELAQQLSVTRWTIYAWIRAGRFRGVKKFGRRQVRIPASEVTRWLKSREITPYTVQEVSG